MGEWRNLAPVHGKRAGGSTAQEAPFLTCGTGTAGAPGASSGAPTRAGCLTGGAADGGAWLDQGGAAQEAAPALQRDENAGVD